MRGWARKAFRILGSPQVTRRVRLDELTQLLSLAGPYDADPAWLAIWGGYQLAPRQHWAFGQRGDRRSHRPVRADQGSRGGAPLPMSVRAAVRRARPAG
jgi:hypothetical protein